MRSFFRYIAATAVFVLVLLTSCRKDKDEVIPRDSLSEIYAEMLLTDQWILNTPNERLIADTSLVYEPILEKYGFDSGDYRKSVETYMDDPERFARILRTTVEILETRLAELEVKKIEQEELKELRLKAEKFRPDLNLEDDFPYMHDEPYIHYFDSVAFEMDTTRIYRLVHIERTDTVFDGPRVIVSEPDTLKIEFETEELLIEDDDK